jgi:hypothetical protein
MEHEKRDLLMGMVVVGLDDISLEVEMDWTSMSRSSTRASSLVSTTNSISSKHGVADPGWAAREKARDPAVLSLQM